MKSGNSALVTMTATLATMALHASAAPTHKLYKLYAKQPSSTQLLGLNWYHSGALISSSELDPLEKIPSAEYYLQGGRLFTPLYNTTYPDVGYDFYPSVGDTPGAFGVAWAEIGLQGRDDWMLAEDGSLDLSAGGPRSSFFKCNVQGAYGGFVDALAFGNFFENGSLPDACESTLKVFATPV